MTERGIGRLGPKALTKTVLKRYGYRLQRITKQDTDCSPPMAAKYPAPPPGSELWYRSDNWRYSIPIDLAVGRPCFSYSEDGWHPYVATIRESITRSPNTYRGSVLERFFARFAPETIGDAYFPARDSDAHDTEAVWRLPANMLFEPWFMREPPFDDPWNSSEVPAGSPLFGPVSVAHGEQAFARIMGIRDSINQHGYNPDAFPRGTIQVVTLRHNGDVRYLVAHGQHRMAALSASGAATVVVGIRPGMPAIVDSEDVDRWPYVRSGRISPDAALKHLLRYFQSDGTAVRDFVG